ncbi:hypothetical protein CF335_g6397 [Tilletia laevis]|nr:hypothetical protein CF335_g6397 [Tilletia laevis]
MSEHESFTLPAGQFDPPTHIDPVIQPGPATPHSVLIHEIRSVSARLDGFNMRLGDMERYQRLQPSQPASPSPGPRLDQSGSANASSGQDLGPDDQDIALPDSVTIRRGRARPDAPIPPHMERAAAALAASTISPPQRASATPATPDSPKPLDRYRSMSKGEKSNVRRALAGLGLSVPTLMSMFSETAEDADLASTTESGEDTAPANTSASSNESPLRPAPSASSNESPLRAVPAAAPDTSASPAPEARASSSTPPAAAPTPAIDPAPNISVAANAPTPVVVSNRPMTCKTEWIGDFNGDPSQLGDFLTRLRDLIRSETQQELIPPWIKAVLRTLPRTLTGNAAVWHQGLSDTEAADLTSVDAWSAAMRAAFPINRGQLRRDARARKWAPSDETSIAYYFHKVRLLRQAFGKDQPDDALVTDIKDGLPESIIGLLRLPRVGATLADLRAELGDWEPNWRVQYKVPLRTSTLPEQGTVSSGVPHTSMSTRTGTVGTPAASRVLQTTMGRSASAPATPAPTMGLSSGAAPPISTIPRSISKFAAAYDPTRVIQASNGQPRRYRPPGKDTVMDLKAPCSYCGGDHFNFEHDYLKVQVRTLIADDDDYEEYLWDGTPEEDGEGEDEDDPSLSLEPGLAPSMFPFEVLKSNPTLESVDAPKRSSDPIALHFADRSVFAITRTLRSNTSAPPLAQEKRAFGKVVALPRHSSTGTGQGYRNHVPLSTHVRVNDTDGRVMSTLLETGASLSCINAALLTKMGGAPTGKPMTVHGVGSSTTLGWITLPLFIAAQDPQGRHVHLEASQDFHVLPSFPPGMCLGLDFIDAHSISISPVRGRARLGRYTFSVHERLDKPFSTDVELRTSSAVTIAPRTQAWIPVNAACLAPGVDYTVVPRLSVSQDHGVCLTGPNGLLTHGPVRHILLGNYGDESFTIEQDTSVADASAARVGDVTTKVNPSVFTLHRGADSPDVDPPPLRPSASNDAGMPFDPFDDDSCDVSSLTKDAATVMVDGVYKVGVDPHGDVHAPIVDLLRRHSSAFALDGRPGQVADADMEIRLNPDATLQSEAPRRASPDKRAAIDSAIDQLLDWDVIEPSSSPVSFPVVMVKQQSKWRFCVDYRRLNTHTVPDRYPLPTIDAIFHTLCGKKIFSSLDAIRGYHQLGIHEDDRWKTAFVCHRGLFQYKRIPFGLHNAPAFFQRFMDRVLGSLRWNQAVIYIDDSVVASDTMDEHIAALEQLFNSAEKVGLRFSPAKCTFAVPSLVLLGRKVSGAGVAIWKDRAQAVATLPRPTTLQELYHTLGLFGYYRAFVRGFAERAAPLTRMLKGWRYEFADGQSRLVNTEGKTVTASRVPIEWGPDQQSSFDALKHSIADPPVLAHPDPSKPYVFYCDASQHGLAAILHQVHADSAPSSVEPVVASMHHLSLPQLPADIARDQWERWLADDPFFGPVLRRVRASTSPDDEWELSGGVLIRRLDDRLALPAAAVPFIMRAVHDDLGHFGFTKTFLATKRRFWRPHLSSMVRSWVKHCATCQGTKSLPKVGSLNILNDPTLPFETISFDLLYGFPRSQSGNDAALAIQDLFSRMILLTPCHKEITAEGVAAIIADRILRLGWRPKRLVADSESRVSGAVATSLAASLGATVTPSSPYHQQANAVERAIQTTQQVLRVMTVDSKSHWDRRILPRARQVKIVSNFSDKV